MADSKHSRGWGCCLSTAAGFAAGMLAVVLVLVMASGLRPALFSGWFGFGPAVAVLDIRGELLDERPILEALEILVENPSTKALVVRVDSPGGIVTVMEEVFGALRRVKGEKAIPVVASMGTVAASGGYYVCLAADRIYSNASTLTGSIGAALEHYNAQELLSKVGVQHEIIQSGPYKSMGTLAEPLTDGQRAQLQELVDEIESGFVHAIAATRPIPLARAAGLADGRVFTGRQALELGLVDAIGDLHDAVDYAAGQAGLGTDYRVIRMPREKRIRLRWLERLGGLGDGSGPRGVVPKYVMN
jgi:protease IV